MKGRSSSRFFGFAGIDTSRPSRTNARRTFSRSVRRLTGSSGDPPREQPAFRTRLAELDIRPVTIHAAYLVNLAGPDPDFFERSVEVLTRELQMAPGFGATFVNVHTGSHRDAGVRAGTERIAEGVARRLAATDDRPDDAVLVLENSAGGGFGLGATGEERAGIATAIAHW